MIECTFVCEIFGCPHPHVKRRTMMHTKGPWTLCNDGECSCMQVSSEHAPIAKVISGKWGDDYPALRLNMDKGSIGAVAEAYMEQIIYGEIPEDVAKANARLIAAAPELLEALEEACDILYNIPEDLSGWQTTNASIQEAHDILEEAIRKAKSHADTLKGE